jgi:glycosyltransferase involved in cell wall biosynthesis
MPNLETRPLVSIITPCLNSEKYIEQTIQSVLNQTYRNIEYIIVDGGSTDRTLDIVRKYESRITRWISEPDKGTYDAMNKGIALSSGELIGILSSNDRYDKDAVRWMVESFNQNKDAFVFFGEAVGMAEYGKKPDITRRIEPFRSCMGINHQSVFVPKDLYKHWLYNPRFKIGADYDLLWKAYAAGMKFCYVNKSITFLNPSGLSGGYRCILEHYAIRKQYSKTRALYLLFVETVCFWGNKSRIKRFLGPALTGEIKRICRRIHQKIKSVCKFSE